MVKISVDKIVVPEIRASSQLTPEQQAFFKGTVEKYGVLQDILVRPLPNGRYELIAGKTRLEELKSRGEVEVEAKVIEASAKDALLMHIAENWARGSVDPISTARVIEKALKEGASVEEVAQIFNHNPDWVKFMVSLLKLPEKYQTALQEQRIKVTHIREAFRLPDLREVDAALSAATTHGWSTTIMHYYVNNRLAELEKAKHMSERKGIEVPPPPPEPERLVKYAQCLVHGGMVPREDIHLPSICTGCYELAKYVTSQFGTGDKGMQAVYAIYQRARAWEALQKPILPPGQERAQPRETPSPPGPEPGRPILPEKSQPISDDKLRAMIKRMMREELERQQTRENPSN